MTFSRPVPTLDHEAIEVAPDTPRYAPSRAIAGGTAFYTPTHTSQNRMRMAVGPNADYTAWVMCAYNTGAARIETSLIDEDTGALISTVTTAQGTAPFTEGETVREPGAISAAPGLLLVMCELKIDGVVRGVSFVYSTDRGASWVVLADYADEPQPGVRRVKEWSMRQWYTLARSEQVPNEFWAPAADYRYPGGPAAGWSGFLVRGVRENPASAWSLEVAKIRQHDRPGFTGGAFHAHSMGLVSDGEGGMIVLVPVGDTIDDNALIKGSLPAGADWREPQQWVWNDSWHGALGDPDAGANEGLQGVGMTVGPEEGTLLIGTDTQAEAIYLVDARAIQAAPKVVYKPQMSDATGQECFTAVNPHPHDPTKRGWFASTRPKTGATGEGTSFATYSRIVFSPDARSWTEIMSASMGLSLYGSTVAASERNIYVASHFGAPANIGVSRRAIPAHRTMRGLMLNDGGEQLVLDSYPVQGGTGVGIVDVTEFLEPLGVQSPPSYGRVFRATRSAGSGRVILNAVMSNELPSGPVTGRLWMYNLANGGNFLTATDTATGGAGTLTPTRGGGSTYFATQEWYAVDLIGVKSLPGILNLRLLTGSQTPVDLLVCFDSVSSGASPASYPQPALAPAAPPETLTVSGFNPLNPMTVYHAFRSQPYGTDVRWPGPQFYPLLSAYADPLNYILVDAEISTDPKIRLTVVEGGQVVDSIRTWTARWSRDEQTLLGLSIDRDAGVVGLTVSHAGSTFTTRVVEKGSAFTTLAPVELRLGWADGSPTFPSVQCALRVLDGVAHPQHQREATLAGVDWIPTAKPACAIDTNGDGVINFADLNAVLSDFGRVGQGLTGDVNCDGVVNFGDLNVILSAFGVAP